MGSRSYRAQAARGRSQVRVKGRLGSREGSRLERVMGVWGGERNREEEPRGRQGRRQPELEVFLLHELGKIQIQIDLVIYLILLTAIPLAYGNSQTSD